MTLSSTCDSVLPLGGRSDAQPLLFSMQHVTSLWTVAYADPMSPAVRQTAYACTVEELVDPSIEGCHVDSSAEFRSASTCAGFGTLQCIVDV